MVTRRSIDWLCEASDDPQRFRMVWSDDPRQPQVVATGALFDVVATDQQFGIEADQLRRRGMPVGVMLAASADLIARAEQYGLEPAGA